MTRQKRAYEFLTTESTEHTEREAALTGSLSVCSVLSVVKKTEKPYVKRLS
jgi:hypothetical protein